MLKRTITGAVITAVSVGFIFLREFVDVKLFDILIYFMALVATFELTRAFNGKINGFQKIAAFLFTAAIIPIAVFWKRGLWQVYIAYAAALCFSSLFIKDESLESIGYSLVTLVYPTLPLTLLTIINDAFGGLSLYVIIVIFTVASFTDVFAYLVGSLLKGKKLCPAISPNKTISGAIGGLLGGIAASVLTYVLLNAINYEFTLGISSTPLLVLFMVLSGAVLSAADELGDLVESFIKRKTGIKDMGTLFPGHGGMLDRIDGLSFVTLFSFVIFSFLA